MNLSSVDWGASDRVDRYSLALVDPFTLNETGSAEFVPSESSVTWDVDSDALCEASIRVIGDFRQGGVERMLRIGHHVSCQGVEVDETLGTFFVDGVSRESESGRLSRTLSCYSSLWSLSEDYLADDYLERAGSGALAACSRLVTYAGRLLTTDQGVDSQATLLADELHMIGDNRLDALRTVAASVGWTVGVDPMGRVTLSPRSEPLDQATRYDFVSGPKCVCIKGIALDPTRAEAVNRVVAWWGRESLPDPDDGTAGWGKSDRVVLDLPESATFSYERCGRRRTHVMQLSEPCEHDELYWRARSFLTENAGDQTDITITHPQIPGLRVGDVVTYRNTTDEPEPLALTCQVKAMSASLTPGMVCETRMRILEWEAR